MVTSGGASPLQTDFQGGLTHSDLLLDIPSVLPRLSPVLALFSKIDSQYKGELSPASEAVSLESLAVPNNIFRWLEFDAERSKVTQINNGAGYADSATSIVVDSAANIKLYDLIVADRTREVMRVTGISGNTLTVTRGWGGDSSAATSYPITLAAVGNAAALVDNDYIRIVGSALAHASTNRDSEFNADTSRVGSTQIIRRDVKISGTRMVQEKVSLSDNDILSARKAQATLDAFEDLEHTFFFGRLMYTSSGGVGTVAQDGNNLTTSDGVYSVIENYASANIQNANTLGVADTSGGQGISMDKLEDIASILAERPGKKSLFCSKDFKKAINKLINSSPNSHNVDAGAETDIGVKVKGYIGSFGTLQFNHHKLFDLVDGSTTAKSKYTLLAVDPAQVKLVHMDSREFSWKDNTQDPAEDAFQSTFLGEHGLAISHGKTHFAFEGFTALGV